MREVVIGVDPGAKGAIAVVDVLTKAVWAVEYLPYIEIKTASGKRRHLDEIALCNMLEVIMKTFAVVRASCEEVHCTPTFGALTNFSLGASRGAIYMLFAAYKVPFEGVKAKAWQKYHFPEKGVKHDKERSIRKVKMEHPHMAEKFSKKDSDGLAEAILIAEYARAAHAGTMLNDNQSTNESKKAPKLSRKRPAKVSE